MTCKFGNCVNEGRMRLSSDSISTLPLCLIGYTLLLKILVDSFTFQIGTHTTGLLSLFPLHNYSGTVTYRKFKFDK